MKNLPILLRLCTAIAFIAGLASISQAQNREKFLISAKAGGVNSVTGQVIAKPAGQAERLLTAQDNLTSGDVVRTAAGARVEVLLNPGSYLRVGENSEFELADNSLDNLRVKFVSGSAIVEATGVDNTELRIGFVTNQGHFVIARRGVYRIDVQPDSTELLVRKGRALIRDGLGEVVKGGNKAVFSRDSVLIGKLGKKDQDEFDTWSKQRAETLARANERLATRAFNGYLSSFNYWDLAFSAANSWGLWAYSPFARCFTFVPFFYGWTSPYGHYYGNYYNLYDYFPFHGCCGGGFGREPVIVNNQPPRGSSGGSGGGPVNPTPVNSAPMMPSPSRPTSDVDSRSIQNPGSRPIRPRDPKK